MLVMSEANKRFGHAAFFGQTVHFLEQRALDVRRGSFKVDIQGGHVAEGFAWVDAEIGKGVKSCLRRRFLR